MTNELKRRIVQTLPRNLLLDLLDMTVAQAMAAHELIRDHTSLRGKSARGAEGQVRFRVMEQGFQDACERNGGIALEGGTIAGTDLRFFQPFMRFGGAASGIVLGLASMPARTERPVKNQSRAAGVSLNYHLTPRLDLDDSGPKPGDIFVLFLVARDPVRAGKVEEIAIGVIDAEYQSYLLYVTIESLMAEYAAPDDGDAAGKPATKLVKLKTTRRAYKPPEMPDTGEESDGSGGA